MSDGRNDGTGTGVGAGSGVAGAGGSGPGGSGAGRSGSGAGGGRGGPGVDGPGGRDLEARGRSAGAALRASVADVPVPLAGSAPGPEGQVGLLRPRPRRGAVLAAAAVLVLALVAVAAMVVGDDGEGGDEVAIGSGAVPRLILGEPVAGFEPGFAVDLPLALPGTALGFGSLGEPVARVYGDAGADDPFLRSDLLLAAVRSVPGTRLSVLTEAGEPVPALADRNGQRGVLGAGFGSAPAVTVEVGEGWTVVVASHGLAPADLEAVAAEVTVDGEAPVPPDELPGGVTLVAEGRWGPPAASLPVPWPNEPGAAVGYQRMLDGGSTGLALSRSLSVVVAVGDRSTLDLARWWIRALEPAEVRGGEGYVGEPRPGFVLALWEESPGVVAVMGFEGTRTDADAALAALRPPTEAEWAELRTPSGIGPRNDHASVGGDTSTGIEWTVDAGPHQNGGTQLCLDIGTSGTCSDGAVDGPLLVAAAALADGTVVVYGAGDLDPGAVRLEAGIDHGFSVAVPEAGGMVFAGTVEPGSPVPTEVVAIDVATGAEVARVPVGEPTPVGVG